MASAKATGRFLTFQTSRADSWIVRSRENVPDRATLSTATTA